VNTRRITLLVAVVLAIGTGVLTLRYLSSVNQQAQQQQQQVELKHVIIANHDIPARAKITPDMLTSVSRPANEVPQQALSDPKQAEGDVALITIPQGSPLTSATIGQPAEVGLTFRLKPGMRAVSIPVDKVKAVSGLIQPGDKVDVMASVKSGAGIPPKTFTIIRGATILAINTQLEQTGTDAAASPAPDGSGAGGGATVTLGVTPGQADLLTVADLNTTLRLALRSPQEPVRSLPAEPLEFADLGSTNVPAPTVAAVAPTLPYPVPTPGGAMQNLSVPAPRNDDGIEIIDGDKVISAQ
jgi:pilus assembly protein CpaB